MKKLRVYIANKQLMEQITKYQYIALLIAKERLGTLSDREKEELTEWIQSKPSNQALYLRLKEKNYSQELELYRHIDPAKGLKCYRQRYTRRRKIIFSRWVAVAAMIVVISGLTLLFTRQQETTSEGMPLILPGSSRAVLVFNDGSVRELDETVVKEEIQINGLTAVNTGKQLRYIQPAADSLQDKKQVFHELCIPRGGEYQLVLADGTKVWLNADTKLKYPVYFDEKERAVYLEGEAYFEVARDEERPFRVITAKHMTVEVLGTSFNVRSYGDEDLVETVLEKGSVRLTAGESDQLLIPGQKGTYQPDKGEIKIENVETAAYTSWRKGEFIFNDEKVEHIMQDIARWYDVEVFYADESVKELVFNCAIKKYETIDVLLHSMEIAGGIRFGVKERTVVVYSEH